MQSYRLQLHKAMNLLGLSLASAMFRDDEMSRKQIKDKILQLAPGSGLDTETEGQTDAGLFQEVDAYCRRECRKLTTEIQALDAEAAVEAAQPKTATVRLIETTTRVYNELKASMAEDKADKEAASKLHIPWLPPFRRYDVVKLKPGTGPLVELDGQGKCAGPFTVKRCKEIDEGWEVRLETVNGCTASALWTSLEMVKEAEPPEKKVAFTKAPAKPQAPALKRGDLVYVVPDPNGPVAAGPPTLWLFDRLLDPVTERVPEGRALLKWCSPKGEHRTMSFDVTGLRLYDGETGLVPRFKEGDKVALRDVGVHTVIWDNGVNAVLGHPVLRMCSTVDLSPRPDQPAQVGAAAPCLVKSGDPVQFKGALGKDPIKVVSHVSFDQDKGWQVFVSGDTRGHSQESIEPAPAKFEKGQTVQVEKLPFARLDTVTNVALVDGRWAYKLAVSGKIYREDELEALDSKSFKARDLVWFKEKREQAHFVESVRLIEGRLQVKLESLIHYVPADQLELVPPDPLPEDPAKVDLGPITGADRCKASETSRSVDRYLKKWRAWYPDEDSGVEVPRANLLALVRIARHYFETVDPPVPGPQDETAG